MTNMTDEEVKMIENRLNNYPSKRMGFRKPAEVLNK
jgi:IS30 family transposase